MKRGKDLEERRMVKRVEEWREDGEGEGEWERLESKKEKKRKEEKEKRKEEEMERAYPSRHFLRLRSGIFECDVCGCFSEEEEEEWGWGDGVKKDWKEKETAWKEKEMGWMKEREEMLEKIARLEGQVAESSKFELALFSTLNRIH